MHKKYRHEWDVTSYSRAVPLSKSLSVVGHRIRFAKSCPLDYRGVYTPRGPEHHFIEQHRVAYLREVFDGFVDLDIKGRACPVMRVPYEFLEWIPQPEPKPELFIAEGMPLPATPDLMGVTVGVRFVERCPVTNGGVAVRLEDSHHSVEPGTVARVLNYREETTICDVTIEGRVRPIRNVPLQYLEVLDGGDLAE